MSQICILSSVMRSGQVVLTSDGSLQGQHDATQGWKLFFRQDGTSAWGHGVVTSGGTAMSSLRPEIGGLLGVLVAVETLLSTTTLGEGETPTQSLKVYLDNKALISQIQKWKHRGPSQTLAPDYDLPQAAMCLVQKHNIELNPLHVKSHQEDSDIAYNELPWEAKLNCDVDALANQARTCLRCHNLCKTKYAPPPGHRASLCVQETWITGHHPLAIREASYRESTEKHIIAKIRWDTKEIHDMADWQARHRAGARIAGSSHKTTRFKLEFDLFATMKQRRKFEKQNDGRCPRCGRFNEDLNHVIRCLRNTTYRNKLWTEMWTTIKGRQTCPYVMKVFRSGMETWLSEGVVQWEGVIPPPNDIIGHTTFEAFINQQDIGWDQAIRGRISVNWGKANALYCQARRLHSDSNIDDHWTTQLISDLWDFGIGQWTSRNQFLYGATEDEQIDILGQEADRIITQLYSQADRLTTSDRFLVSIPCQVRKSRHTLSQKLLWIWTVETSLQEQHPGGMQAQGDEARLRLAPRLEMLEGPRRPRACYRQS